MSRVDRPAVHHAGGEGPDARSRARSGLWILCACQAVLSAGMSLSFPFFAIYLHRDRGLPMTQVGLFLSMALLAMAMGQACAGELSDIVGRRRMMLASLWGRTFAVLLLAAAVWGRWTLPSVLLLHLASSFCGNLFDPSAGGWLADHFGPRERVRGYGLLRIAVNLGWAIGPALGGWLARDSYAALFFIGASTCAACAVVVGLWLRDKPGATRAQAFELAGVFSAAGDARFLRFCVWVLLLGSVMSQLVATLSIHALDFLGLREGQVGLLFTLNGLMVVALQHPINVWWSRWRMSTALYAGSLFYALGYGALAFAPGFRALAAAVAVVTVGEMIVSPGANALAANMAPASMKGRYIGFMGLMHQAGAALGPLLGGLGLQYLSPACAPAPWLMVGGLAAVAGVGFRSMSAVLTREEEGPP